jgi:WD40 repeat protein
MLQMQNAYTGEMRWEGGGRDGGLSAFSKDENRLIYAIEGKGGFLHLDSWTGKEQGPLIKGNARVGAWSPGADRVYAAWHYVERMMLRATGTSDGSNRFEYPLFHYLPRNSILSRGSRLFLATSSSPESRVIDVLDSFTGTVIDTSHLLGKFDNFALHTDESHLLCFTDKRVAFLQWDFPESSIKGVPEFQGLWFLDGSKLAASVPKTNKLFLKIYDLTKPKVDPGGAFSTLVRPNSVFFNRDRSLVLYKDGAKPEECVVARIEAKGMSEISRWKCASSPRLSPSGNRAWSRDGVYETATGKQLLNQERKDSTETVSARWLDESRVLELQALKRKDEDAPDEFHGNAYVIWEAETGKMLFRLQAPRALTFESSPDGRWIAEGGIDGRLRIRSAKTLEVSKEYKVHDTQVTEVSWHPSKPVILTAARGEHFVKAWDHRDGSLVQSFRCWKFPLNLGVSPHGDLIGITHNGSPLFLPLDLSRLRD